MKYKYTVEYSNLVCRFGPKELLEKFKDRFYPIFKKTLQRTSGETYQYKFINLEFVMINKEPYFVGRLVARMRLKARQKMKDGQLYHTRESIQSDPTSVFLLRMSDHKFTIIPEQPRSPKTKTFEFVLKKLLEADWDKLYKRERLKFMKKLGVKRLSKVQNMAFWAKFETEFPQPSVHLNPIGSPEEVRNVLSAFSKVKALKLTFNKPNNEDFELDEKLVQMFSQSVNRTNSLSASQEYRNPKEGLDADSVENLVKASTETGGNCNFKVTGVSTTGENIQRTDDHTKIKPTIEFDSVPTDSELRNGAVSKLDELVENDQISLATTPGLTEKRAFAVRIKNELGG